MTHLGPLRIFSKNRAMLLFPKYNYIIACKSFKNLWKRSLEKLFADIHTDIIHTDILTAITRKDYKPFD